MSRPAESPSPPYGSAALAGAAVLVLYAVTLAPTTAFWDASEYIATAHILGIPHPPGNPLFVVLGRVWDLLLAPTGLPVAARLNLFAAATTALASGLFFLVAHRILAGVVADRAIARVGAGTAVLLGATAFTVWNQSTANEKVYTVSMAVIAAVTWLAVRWYDRRDEPGSLRFLLGAGYLLVLGTTNHLMSFLPALALLVLVLVAAPRVLARKELWVRAVPLAVVGLSFNLFLPVRAAQRPVINEGDPTCPSLTSALVTSVTVGRVEACEDLSAVLRREQYQKPPLTQRMAPFSAQLESYWQYFDWQWARGLARSEQPGTRRTLVTLLFLGLGLAGLGAAWKADRALFAYLGALTLTATLGLVFYLNFRYGFSLAPEIADYRLHEVRERDYFFIASFLLWGVLAGIGLAWLWSGVASLVSGRMARRSVASAEAPSGPTARARWATSPLLAIALVPLATNWAWASRRGDWAARDWAYDLLQSVEPYGILFTNGDNDTFPLWYLQEVEGLRQDVTVIVGQYLYTDWYASQLQELTLPGRQRPFEPDEAPSLYAPGPPAPVSPLIDASPDELRRSDFGLGEGEVTLPIGPVELVYPPGSAFDREERLALEIIRDSFDERPIYFTSSGGLMADLGLDRWAVKQGIVAKLVPFPPGESPGGDEVVPLPQGFPAPWMDLDRTLFLVEEVYLYRGLVDRPIWQDRATLNIPTHFFILHLELAEAARVGGLGLERVRAFEERAERFRILAMGGPEGIPEYADPGG